MADVELVIGGKAHAGWQSAEVTLSMETLAGAFRLGLTDRWRIDQTPREVKTGAECLIRVDGEDMLRGHVNRVLPFYGAGEHGFGVEGRDVTGDMVDCAPFGVAGDWTDADVLTIAQALTAGFGIDARADGAGVLKPFRRFAIQPGETAWSAIERLARLRALLPLSDGLGTLLLTTPGTERIGVIEQGVNVLSTSGIFDETEVFSEYIVRGQSAGDDFTEPGVSAGSEGIHSELRMRRDRPTVILAEADGEVQDYEARAKYEATVAWARSRRATYRVQGWRVSQGGPLWRPNKLVKIRDSFLRLDVEWLVAEARFLKDGSQGTVTDLTVMPRDAFSAEPVTGEEEAGL